MPTPISDWQSLLTALADTNASISMVVTGGGSGAITHCFRRAGASHNFVDAAIPYSRAAVVEYLGCSPDGPSASVVVARQLASAALRRSIKLDDESESDEREPAGIALVAALPTTPPRPAQNQIHVVLQSQQPGVAWSVMLANESCSREQAETIAEEMVFAALAELSGHANNDAFFAEEGLELTRVELER